MGAEVTSGKTYAETWAEMVDEAAEGKTAIPPESGLAALDQLIGPVRPGRLVVLAGHGHQATAAASDLALTWTRNATINQARPVLFHSIEVARTVLVTWLLAAETGIPIRTLSDCTDDEKAQIAATVDAHGELPLHINDTPDGLVGDLFDSTVAHIRRHGTPELVVVDGARLLAVREPGGADAVFRTLKVLAMTTKTPIVATARLENPPTRGASSYSVTGADEAIRRHPDVAIIVASEDEGRVNLSVSKSRISPLGAVTVGWDSAVHRCLDVGEQ